MHIIINIILYIFTAIIAGILLLGAAAKAKYLRSRSKEMKQNGFYIKHPHTLRNLLLGLLCSILLILIISLIF